MKLVLCGYPAGTCNVMCAIVFFHCTVRCKVSFDDPQSKIDQFRTKVTQKRKKYLLLSEEA